MRRQLSAPVSLMVAVIGVALSYYVLHAHGWNLSGDVPLGYVYRGLGVPSSCDCRPHVEPWGMGSFLIALLLAKKASEQLPPSA